MSMSEKMMIEKLNIETKEKSKYFKMYKLCKKWVSNLNNGINIKDKFDNNNISKIALYGWGELAWLLVEELGMDKIEYVIDRNADNLVLGCPVYSPQDDLPMADLIVVTIIDQYEKIYEMLAKKTNSPLCSIDDLVCENKWKI
ncbi:MAG: hypothetical protein J6J79_06900 [Lachnospiraceae bacterium]|nr:hypothetical protein [Lachnospiraceae bacterium]